MAELDPTPMDALYDVCSKAVGKHEERYEKSFTQQDLLVLCDCEQLRHITNGTQLMSLIQKMANAELFKPLKNRAGLVWVLRPRDAAAKIRKLNQDERMVYGVIEDAHKDGTWTRTIKKKTNLTNPEKALRSLQALRLVRGVKNGRAPAQKSYVLYHLALKDDITGGSFYDGGDLDDGLVSVLCDMIVFWVGGASWVNEKRMKPNDEIILIEASEENPVDKDVVEISPEKQSKPPNGTNHTESSPERKRKREHEEKGAEPQPDQKRNRPNRDDAQPHSDHKHQPQEVNGTGAHPRKHRSHKHGHNYEVVQLSHPPGHTYPTAGAIHDYIVNNDVIRADKAKTITIEEIQNCINVLVWDRRLEKINGGYRTVRGVSTRPPRSDGGGKGERDGLGTMRGNGLTEIPCGRCPVTDLCEDGGPISAASCKYLDRWLQDVGTW